MMKKLLITALISLSFISLVGCGNKDIIGTTFTFKYAKIKLVDGQIVEGEVKQWANTTTKTAFELLLKMERCITLTQAM